MFKRAMRAIGAGGVAALGALFVGGLVVHAVSVRWGPFGTTLALAIALLPSALALTAATVVAIVTWRRLRPLSPHICDGCGYDLRSATGPACPECGRDRGPVRIEAYRRPITWGVVLAIVTLGTAAAMLDGTMDHRLNSLLVAALLALVVFIVGWQMVLRCPRCGAWLTGDHALDPTPDERGRVKSLFHCRRCNIAWWTGSHRPPG